MPFQLHKAFGAEKYEGTNCELETKWKFEGNPTVHRR